MLPCNDIVQSEHIHLLLVKRWENGCNSLCYSGVCQITSIIHNNVLSSALSINISKLKRISASVHSVAKGQRNNSLFSGNKKYRTKKAAMSVCQGCNTARFWEFVWSRQFGVFGYAALCSVSSQFHFFTLHEFSCSASNTCQKPGSALNYHSLWRVTTCSLAVQYRNIFISVVKADGWVFVAGSPHQPLCLGRVTGLADRSGWVWKWRWLALPHLSAWIGNSHLTFR